jgi:hypothetical protein
VTKSKVAKTEIGTQSDSTVATDIATAITAVNAIDADVASPRSQHYTRQMRYITKKLNRMAGRLHRL